MEWVDFSVGFGFNDGIDNFESFSDVILRHVLESGAGDSMETVNMVTLYGMVGFEQKMNMSDTSIRFA